MVKLTDEVPRLQSSRNKFLQSLSAGADGLMGRPGAASGCRTRDLHLHHSKWFGADGLMGSPGAGSGCHTRDLHWYHGKWFGADGLVGSRGAGSGCSTPRSRGLHWHHGGAASCDLRLKGRNNHQTEAYPKLSTFL